MRRQGNRCKLKKPTQRTLLIQKMAAAVPSCIFNELAKRHSETGKASRDFGKCFRKWRLKHILVLIIYRNTVKVKKMMITVTKSPCLGLFSLFNAFHAD